MESRKWQPTTHGFRSVRTVNPPSTACAGMARKASPASRGARRCDNAAINVATATSTSAKVRLRLENSMIPWAALRGFGVSESPLHRGQVGQPSPELVSRTAPPVTTMTTLPTTDATARR